MPKGQGLGLGQEMRSGTHLVRPKRYSTAKSLFIAFEWPHASYWKESSSWKKHRKTQYRTKDAA